MKQNYEAILNEREGKTPTSIQGIYDMIYAPKITPFTVRNFCRGIMLMDDAIFCNGTRALVTFRGKGDEDDKVIVLEQLDPQLREVMVTCLRLRHKVRDNSADNDYVHLGLENYRGRLYLETKLKLPSGEKAGDLAELGIAIREHLGLYEEDEEDEEETKKTQ